MRASISSTLAAALSALSVTVRSTPAVGESGTIAFVTLGQDGFDLATVGPEAGVSTILDWDSDDLDPAWAPGGDRLALARTQPGNPISDIWTFTPQGLGAVRHSGGLEHPTPWAGSRS